MLMYESLLLRGAFKERSIHIRGIMCDTPFWLPATYHKLQEKDIAVAITRHSFNKRGICLPHG